MRVFSINPNVYSAANNQCCPSKKKQNPAFGGYWTGRNTVDQALIRLNCPEKYSKENIIKFVKTKFIEEDQLGKDEIQEFIDSKLFKDIEKSLKKVI